ncbi:carboxypeptidase regulatory-like domain-containing protein [Silvibacterium acidisoli]|uniref:carboxypeptidase regulatory-like domain-containing protein n=1 Tax=Acidobacteriaceae bacterium ZG23-2 TaxID=2883246 RepID=UPI00406D398D
MFSQTIDYRGQQRSRLFRVSLRMFFLCVLGLFFSTHISFGQGVSGRLQGTIQDSTGAVVNGAHVVVINQDTGQTVSLISNEQGSYLANLLPPGTYRVEVEAAGFQKVVSKGNVVTVDNVARVDITLQPGTASQSVEVTGSNPLVNTTSSSLGEVLSSHEINSLPLNGRVFSQLVQTVPGSVATGFGSAPEAAAGAGAAGPISASVNGMPWGGTTYTLDGVSNMELLNAFINVTPALDSLQEVKVSTNNAEATVGTYGGAQVNAFVKSGTNEFHGSAYEYFRNDSLNAIQWQAKSKAPYRSNEFGGSLGGPIIRNKAFFFVDYQGLLLNNGIAYNLTVPTDLMRQGYFLTSQFPAIYDPSTGNPFPIVSTPQGPAYQIPSSRFDSVAGKMVGAAGIWPEATNQNSISQNYQANTQETDNNHQFDVKVDYQLRDNDRFFARESYQRRDLTAPSPGTRFIEIGDVNAMSRDHNIAVGWDHIFSATTNNELRFGFNRFYTKDFGNDFQTNENTTLGIPNGNNADFPGASGLAIFNIGNIAPTGSQDWTNSHRITNVYQITDNFTKILGKHTFVFGEDYRRLQASLTNANASQNGSFSFNADYTSSCTGQPDCTTSSGGNAFASYLLGIPSSLYRGFVDTDPATRAHLAGIYAQDEYHVAKGLTLNLALRWDVITQAIDKFNRQSNFNLQTGLLDIATSDNRAPNVDNYYGNFAPRVGFSYTPNDGRTAIRGAFGMTTFPGNFGAIGGNLERNFPFFQQYYVNQQLAYTPFWNVTTNGLPGFIPISTDAPVTPQPNSSVTLIPRSFRPDNAYAWHLGVEQQLTATSAFRLSYVGTRGIHLYRDYNIDTPVPGPGDLTTRRPYYDIAPEVTSINYATSDGRSIYHALQAEISKNFSHGLQGRISYTWSREEDDMNVFYPLDDRYNWAPGTSQAPDVPQNFIANFVYQLPFGRGREWLANSGRTTDLLLGGWQLSSITILQSGQPLSFGISNDNLNSGFSNRANLACNTIRKIGKTTEWFDTSCLTTPPQYVLGNSGVGKVRGPSYRNSDVSLSKSVSFREHMAASFQVDAFNLTNTPHYANPNTTCCTAQNPSFGQITSTNGTPREIQLGGRFTF